MFLFLKFCGRKNCYFSIQIEHEIQIDPESVAMIYVVKRPISTSQWNMCNIREFITIWFCCEIFSLIFSIYFSLSLLLYTLTHNSFCISVSTIALNVKIVWKVYRWIPIAQDAKFNPSKSKMCVTFNWHQSRYLYDTFVVILQMWFNKIGFSNLRCTQLSSVKWTRLMDSTFFVFFTRTLGAIFF